MLLLVVGWIFAIFFSEVSPSSIYLNYNASKVVQLESNTSGYTSIIIVLKNLHWLPVEHCSLFKTATLVYKFLYTGFPKYFTPYLSSNSSAYITRCSQNGRSFFVVPKFHPSTHKSVKQFGYSFAFDAPTIWNALLDEIRVSPS